MRKFEVIFDFAHGTMTKAARITLNHGGVTLNGEALAAGHEIIANGAPERNPPGMPSASEAEFDRIVREADWKDYPITLQFTERFHHRAALVGWLRAGYLAAFAALGYKYIARPSLAVVREQINAPTEDLIPIFSATDGVEPQRGDRVMMLVNEPQEMRCLLVKMGRHIVFLPPADDRGDFYERFTPVARKAPLPQSLSGKVIPWPTRPSHRLD